MQPMSAVPSDQLHLRLSRVFFKNIQATMSLAPAPTRLRQIALVAKDIQRARQLLVGHQCEGTQIER
jgi:hypothetical protein